MFREHEEDDPMNVTPSKRPGPALWLSIVTIVLGIAIGVGSIVAIVVNVSDQILGTTYVVPSTHRIHLDTGTYLILERTGSRDNFDVGTRSTDLNPTQVDVLGPDRGRVSLTSASHSETITRTNGTYVAALEFEARRSGAYRLDFHVTKPGLVMVQQPLGDVAKDNLAWGLGIALGALLVFAGLIMLIVGIVRRSKAKRQAAAPYAALPGFPPVVTAPGAVPGLASPSPSAPPTAVPWVPPANVPTANVPTETAAPAAVPTSPPAWHPDPLGQHRLRYWDGTSWTEHTSD